MPESGWPSERTSPADAPSRPAAMLSKVDLPQPVGPTTETNSPAPTVSGVSSTAVKPLPAPSPVKVTVMLDRDSAGAGDTRSALLLLTVFLQRFLRETVVERFCEVDFRGLHCRLERVQHLVN